MKKIFIIIASVFIVGIMGLIGTLGFIKTNVPITYAMSPYKINVFNHTTNHDSYTSTDGEYQKLLDEINNITNLSMLTRLVNNEKIDKKVEQDIDGTYSKWSLDMNSNGYAVELLFVGGGQDAVVEANGNTRVITYLGLMYVFPKKADYEKIIVYYSTTNNEYGEEKSTSYKSCEPLVIYGNTNAIIDLIEKIKEA
ncbi:MAG: hypothetical protein IJ538_02845 [Clostridia bacterium]|nr:hypothetical protein [Clostridia bacterium]